MRCRWCLFALVAVLIVVPAIPAQPPIERKNGQYIVPLTVSPTAPTKPALKYKLLPEISDMKPGNQIQAFYKCFFEQHNLFHDKEFNEKQEKWLAAPLAELKDVKELEEFAQIAVNQAHYAARLDTVDWQITNQAKSDGVMLLLPDVQQMRMLIRVLKLRCRGEIARGDFEAAHRTIQTMFALSRTFNEHPTLIGGLVGIAMHAITMGCVEEFIQQPGAPNLYWPIADLPDPFIDLRKGREGEALFVPNDFSALNKPVPLTDEQLKELMEKLNQYTDVGQERPKIAERYAEAAKDEKAVAAARASIAEFGYKPAELAKLSPLQTLLMDNYLHFEVDQDEFFKWTNFEFRHVPEEFGKPSGRLTPFGELLPAYYKVLWARARMRQHVRLLMTAEAVRAYAAENNGKLPASLDDVKLPLPVDPTTGKHFVYELKDGKAVISCTPPKDQLKNPNFNRVYEITIRK